MTALGDFFSDDFKALYASQSIAIGSVVKCFVKNTNPPKEKRFIIVGIDAEGNLVGIVFINSTINYNVIRSSELANCQIYLEKSNNNFLDWDSYVDCAQLYEISRSEVLQSIAEKPRNVLGSVSMADLTIIRQKLTESPIIKPKLLKKYSIF